MAAAAARRIIRRDFFKLIEGKNNSSCAMRYVEKSEDVKEGDIIVTSGLDNIFPKGFPVATVVAVENKAFSVSLKVDLKPIVDPDKIEEVFVVLNAANEDMSEKMALNTETSNPADIKIETTTEVKKSNEPEKINR